MSQEVHIWRKNISGKSKCENLSGSQCQNKQVIFQKNLQVDSQAYYFVLGVGWPRF